MTHMTLREATTIRLAGLFNSQASSDEIYSKALSVIRENAESYRTDYKFRVEDELRELGRAKAPKINSISDGYVAMGGPLPYDTDCDCIPCKSRKFGKTEQAEDKDAGELGVKVTSGDGLKQIVKEISPGVFFIAWK